MLDTSRPISFPATVDLTSLHFTTNGGEPVRRSSIEAFEERFGVPGRVLPAYGLAEATVGVTTHLPGLLDVMALLQRVCGDLTQPGTGIAFTVPVERLVGLAAALTEGSTASREV